VKKFQTTQTPTEFFNVLVRHSTSFKNGFDRGLKFSDARLGVGNGDKSSGAKSSTTPSVFTFVLQSTDFFPSVAKFIQKVGKGILLRRPRSLH
jgi:hypothetical protein